MYELVERRRQALPLVNSQTAELVDIALEGNSGLGPVPTIPELAALSSKLTELKLKQAKEKAKSSLGESSSRPRGRGPRGRDRGRGTRSRDPKGKAPATSDQ